MSAQKSCGLGKWYRPGWIQRFATIRWFTAFSAFYGFCFGIFPLYTVSQVTAFEKHFDLSSQRSGLIVSGAEIGFIFSALVIGYFSNHYHRPRILGYCTVLICAGCLVADVPFYLDIANNRQTTPAHLRSFNSTCGASRNSAVCDDVTALGRDDVTSSFWYIFAGTVLYGAGSCGMWTIGVSYIDDNADSKKAYLYVGLVICIRFLAPVGGLMLGAAVAPVPVHITDTGGSPEDVDWVGAWWIGYYLIFGLVLISSLPFWCYPKVLCNVDEPSDRMSRRVYTVATQEYAADNDAVDDVGEAPPDGTRTNYNESPSKSTEKLEEMDIRECAGEKTNMGQLLKGFPSALWRLLRNPIFMCGSLATSLDFSISIGFGAFVPKFFETYFHTTAAVANAVTGVALAFSACIGSGLGGYLMSRVKWRLNRMLLVATIVNMGICVLIGPILLLKCPSVRMVGIHDSGSTTNLSRSCNDGCDCETSLYSPVCDGQTAFFSPCHAGCTNRYQNGSFSECACTPNSSDLLMPGLCERQCTLEMALYAILLFVLVMCLSAAEIPAYMLNIRSVGESDKALGLAILNVFTSAFAFPMPILFGWMVDGACVAVQKFACADGAACALYDNEQLKYRLHLLPAGLKIVPTVVYTLAWYLSRDATFAGDEVAPTAAMDENTTSAVYDNQTLDHEDEINTKI